MGLYWKNQMVSRGGLQEITDANGGHDGRHLPFMHHQLVINPIGDSWLVLCRGNEATCLLFHQNNEQQTLSIF